MDYDVWTQWWLQSKDQWNSSLEAGKSDIKLRDLLIVGVNLLKCHASACFDRCKDQLFLVLSLMGDSDKT